MGCLESFARLKVVTSGSKLPKVEKGAAEHKMGIHAFVCLLRGRREAQELFG